MPPSNKELKYHGYALEYAAQLQASPWYMAEPQASTSSGMLSIIAFVVSHSLVNLFTQPGVEQYSDRFLSKGTHDVSILQQEETMSRLNKEFFPTNLWEPFYERKMAKTQSALLTPHHLECTQYHAKNKADKYFDCREKAEGRSGWTPARCRQPRRQRGRRRGW